MKSPHLLSTVHDSGICTRSAQSVTKREDFHHDSDCRLTVLGRLFHDRFPHESCSDASLCQQKSACLSRVGRTPATGEETDRYRQCIHGFESPSPILSKSLSEFLHFVHKRPFFPHRQRSPSRRRLHDHFSGDPLYTTIALQPIVSAATTISHTNTQWSIPKRPTVGVIQCCRARIHVVTLCASC